WAVGDAHVHARCEAVRRLPAEARGVDAEAEAVSGEGRVGELVRVVEPERLRVEERGERRRAGRPVDGDGRGATGEVGAHLQIGRASCRGRGWGTVGGGSVERRLTVPDRAEE